MSPAAWQAALRAACAAAFAATLALPAAAEIHKCVGPQGTVYTEGACPASASSSVFVPKTHPSIQVPPTGAGPGLPAPAPAPAPAAPVPDAPLPLVDTHVALIDQSPGKFAWLDADTLAITTYGDEHAKVPWMVRRVVAWSAATQATTTVVARGFLDCANAEAAIVGVQLGDLESQFLPGARSARPVAQFQQWDAARKALAAAPAPLTANWNASACQQTAPEDVASTDWLTGRKPVRYLQPAHGLVRWGMGESGRPEGPTLVHGSSRTPLEISANDVARRVRWLAWRKAYQLGSAAYKPDSRTPIDTPAVLMDARGTLTRLPLPEALKRALDARGMTGTASGIAVRPGLLVAVDASGAQGGGLYLVEGGRSRRVWCGATDVSCHVEQGLEVSPDGCRIAFDPAPQAGGRPTLKLLDLCPAGPARKSK